MAINLTSLLVIANEETAASNLYDKRIYTYTYYIQKKMSRDLYTRSTFTSCTLHHRPLGLRVQDQQPWSICDLPTDASEGEEQPRAPPGPRVETPLEPIARASQASVPPAPGEAPCLAASAARESPRAFPSACFCYASPLAKGLRELNVRAEWEAASKRSHLRAAGCR